MNKIHGEPSERKLIYAQSRSYCRPSIVSASFSPAYRFRVSQDVCYGCFPPGCHLTKCCCARFERVFKTSWIIIGCESGGSTDARGSTRDRRTWSGSSNNLLASGGAAVANLRFAPVSGVVSRRGGAPINVSEKCGRHQRRPLRGGAVSRAASHSGNFAMSNRTVLPIVILGGTNPACVPPRQGARGYTKDDGEPLMAT